MSYADTKPLTGPPVTPVSYPANVGPTAPPNPQQGSIWIDNSTPALLIKIFDSGSWTTAGQQPAPVIPPQIFHGALTTPPATANAGDVYYLTADIAAPGAATIVPWNPLMTTPLQGGAEPDPASPGNPLRVGGAVVPLPSTAPLWGTSYLGVSYVLSGGSTALITRINAGETTPVQFAAGVNPPFTVYVAPPPSAKKGFYQYSAGAWVAANVPTTDGPFIKPLGALNANDLLHYGADQNWRGFSPVAVAAPATPTSTGIKGQVAFDSNNVYFCIDTDQWIRVLRDNTGGW
jgi:hypothetical protein